MKRKSIIWLVLLVAFLSVETLNFTGFCYAEKRWLTPEQIRYRITTHEWRNKTPIPPDEEIERVARKNEQLNCCDVVKFSPFAPYVDHSFLKTVTNRLFGFYHYYAVSVREVDERYKTPERYAEEKWYYVDACGRDTYGGYGEGLTKAKYLERMKSAHDVRLMEETKHTEYK